MAATLTWLDFSSEERRRAIEVIKLFEERTTVDDLGIGTVRDAISDILFPGTSVLHTRARYLLFVPWIYRMRESKSTASSEIAKKSRRDEIKLIESILVSDDPRGTIGRLARERLKFLPSTIYWNGLERWGVRRFHGSQDAYHRSLDRWYDVRDVQLHDDDGGAITPFRPNWDPALPATPQGFPNETIPFTLTRGEAEYLRERLLSSCPGSLIAFLADEAQTIEPTDFVWEHPSYGSFPGHNRTQVLHARMFSEAIHGAALCYNLLLAEALPRDSENWVGDYRGLLAGWVERLNQEYSHFKEWNREDFWTLVHSEHARIPVPTRVFVDRWLDLLLGGNPATLPDNAVVRRLLTERERFMKGKLARLQNREALNQWNGATGSGAGQLGYRWRPMVHRIVTDIQMGLKRHA